MRNLQKDGNTFVLRCIVEKNEKEIVITWMRIVKMMTPKVVVTNIRLNGITASSNIMTREKQTAPRRPP